MSFNSLLLLERIQISWFPGWLPEKELSITLKANPVVEWFLRHKCPEIRDWLDKILSIKAGKCSKKDIHKFLIAKGYQWSRFEEPGDGKKRKYWKSIL